MPPTNWCKDCVVARRCKLFLGAELERYAMVLDDPFLWQTMERRREFRETYAIKGLTNR